MIEPRLKGWRHDIQYNDIQHNDIQHKGLIWDTQHKGHSAVMLCIECHYASVAIYLLKC